MNLNQLLQYQKERQRERSEIPSERTRQQVTEQLPNPVRQDGDRRERLGSSRKNVWIVQRYDGPVVGWFTVSDEFDTHDEAYLRLVNLNQTISALYAVCRVEAA